MVLYTFRQWVSVGALCQPVHLRVKGSVPTCTSACEGFCANLYSCVWRALCQPVHLRVKGSVPTCTSVCERLCTNLYIYMGRVLCQNCTFTWERLYANCENLMRSNQRLNVNYIPTLEKLYNNHEGLYGCWISDCVPCPMWLIWWNWYWVLWVLFVNQKLSVPNEGKWSSLCWYACMPNKVTAAAGLS